MVQVLYLSVCVWLNVQIKPEFAYFILIDHALNGQLLFVQNCDNKCQLSGLGDAPIKIQLYNIEIMIIIHC